MERINSAGGIPVEGAIASCTSSRVISFVRIIEEPASNKFRFRYECELGERRSAGSILGVNSTPENQTYPTIKIFGFTGPVTIVVSCVTKDGDPFKPHPHQLVGRGCNRGIYTIRTEITAEKKEVQFRNLGILCVKRQKVKDSLRDREELGVDPFNTGFAHRHNPRSIDLNAVRLAFEVRCHTAISNGYVNRPLTAVSDIIYDKKTFSDLSIREFSPDSGTMLGGTKVILLCEKVPSEGIAVIFYEEDATGQEVWREQAIPITVHKQSAIVFLTPRYRNLMASDSVEVKFHLKRLKDNARSSPMSFKYYQEPDLHKIRKRKSLLPSLATYNLDKNTAPNPVSIPPPPYGYLIDYVDQQPTSGPSYLDSFQKTSWNQQTSTQDQSFSPVSMSYAGPSTSAAPPMSMLQQDVMSEDQSFSPLAMSYASPSTSAALPMSQMSQQGVISEDQSFSLVPMSYVGPSTSAAPPLLQMSQQDVMSQDQSSPMSMSYASPSSVITIEDIYL